MRPAAGTKGGRSRLFHSTNSGYQYTGSSKLKSPITKRDHTVRESISVASRSVRETCSTASSNREAPASASPTKKTKGNQTKQKEKCQICPELIKSLIVEFSKS